MEHRKDEPQKRTDSGVNQSDIQSATRLQEANASGENNNEQGQASFATGSTTGGGSNFGQGSSHLGGESYRQGDKTNTGANYNNEGEGIGSSSTGTSNEGSSSPNAGAAQSGADTDLAAAPTVNSGGQDIHPDPDERGQNTDDEEQQREGDRRDTSLERDSGLTDGTHTSADSGRQQSGSWSRSTTSGT